jgi:hypothetical protein
MFVKRLSEGEMSFQHRSCVAGNGPRIQVMRKVVSEPSFDKT